MTGISGFGFALAALAASLAVSLLIVLTKPLHSRLSLDHAEGVQKHHATPTPRIGGIGLIAGLLAAWAMMGGEARLLLTGLGVASLPALVMGLGEDLTKAVGADVRMVAALAAGLFFPLVTGYYIIRVELSWFDPLLTNYIFAVGFTAFAIGTATNAINLIDGFHGLASGTMMIMLAAIGGVAWSVGDMVLVQVTLAIVAATAGFFVLNFPFGKIFLGDGGAYFLGFLVSALTVILPMRNPEVSPWVCPLILAYPLTETVVSIARRLKGEGSHPGQPDDMHLHHLVYRMVATRPGKHSEARDHALTSMTLWMFPAVSAVLVALSGFEKYFNFLALLCVALAYVLLYRLLRKRYGQAKG